jgi:hypothetical protein
MLVIWALRRLRQEDHQFKAILGYIVRSCLEIPKKKNNNNNKRNDMSPPFASGWHFLGPRLFHKIQGRTLCFGGVLWEQSLQRENPLPRKEPAVYTGDRTQRRQGGCNPTTCLSQQSLEGAGAMSPY